MKRILLFIGLKIAEIVPLTIMCVLVAFFITKESEKLGLWAEITLIIISGVWLVWAFCFVKIWQWMPEFIKANWKRAGKILEREK